MGGCHDRAPHIVSLGPLMVGIAGSKLGQVEREVLRHPSIGGVILFHATSEAAGSCGPCAIPFTPSDSRHC